MIQNLLFLISRLDKKQKKMGGFRIATDMENNFKIILNQS